MKTTNMGLYVNDSNQFHGTPRLGHRDYDAFLDLLPQGVDALFPDGVPSSLRKLDCTFLMTDEFLASWFDILCSRDDRVEFARVMAKATYLDPHPAFAGVEDQSNPGCRQIVIASEDGQLFVFTFAEGDAVLAPVWLFVSPAM